jgi:hypothetical protein
MKVYCVKDERGWLFREQPVPRISGVPEGDENALALMVYLSVEEAVADAVTATEESVVEVRSPHVITEALYDGRVQYVRIHWGDGEDTVCALPGWRAFVEEFERALEEASELTEEELKRRWAYQFIGELLESGDLEYDIETDTLRRPE